MAFSFSNLFKSSKENSTQETLAGIPRIAYKGGTKYASNETCDVYVDFEELGGFPYIKTVIIGDLNTKVKRVGSTLTFQFKNDAVTIHSDNTTIESNKIKNTPFFVTEIDFEISANEAAKIKNNTVQRIEFTFKNDSYSFKKI